MAHLIEPNEHLDVLELSRYSSPDYDPYATINIGSDRREEKIIEEKDTHLPSFSSNLRPYSFGGQHKKWEPAVFRIPTVLAFLLILLTLISGLEAFLRLSHKNSGFTEPSTAMKNFLTYIPVVVLIFVGWFWKLYDLEVKKVAPWADMRKQPTCAKDSLLLDYVSANYFAGAFIAVRRKHWPVISVIIGSLIIAMATILATSLWVIETPTPQPRAISLLRPLPFESGGFRNDTGKTYLAQYIGGLLYNLPSPSWTTNIHSDLIPRVLTPFRAVEEALASERIQATTQAYSSELLCEPLDVSFLGAITPSSKPIDEYDYPVTTYQMKIGWRGCERNINITHPSIMLCKGSSLIGDITNKSGYWGDNYAVECSGTTITALMTVHFDKTIPDRYTGIACTTTTTKSDATFSVDASTYALLGNPDFSSPQKVTLPQDNSIPHWLSYTLRRYQGCGTVQGTTFDDYGWPSSFIDDRDLEPNMSYTFSSWVNLLIRARNFTVNDIMDANRLAEGSTAVYRNIFPLIAQQQYNTTFSEIFDGAQFQHLEKRLLSKDFSVRIVQVALMLLCVIIVLLYFLRPTTHLNRDPSSLASLAILLSTNLGFAECFSGTSTMTERELSQYLENIEFHTNVQANGASTIGVKGVMTDAKHPSAVDTSRFWNPPMLHIATKLTLFTLIGGTIAALEVLVQQSEHHGGLSNIGSTGWGKYSWTYVAPAALFVLGLGITSFDFAARATIPYQKMATSRSARILKFNPLLRGLHTLIPFSIRHGMPLLALSAVAVLAIPAAKIAVAGVFYVGLQPVSQTSRLRVNEVFNRTFNPTNSEVGVTSTLSALTSLKEYDLHRPLWTMGKYAVAAAEIPKVETTAFEVRLPVAYSTLDNCTVEKAEFVNIPHGDPRVYFSDSDCPFISMGGDRLPDAPNPSYMGFAYAYSSNRRKGANPEGCLRKVLFVFGEAPLIGFNNTGTPNENVTTTAISCNSWMWTSTMIVSLNVNNDNYAITDVKHNTEEDREEIDTSGFGIFDDLTSITPAPGTQFDSLFKVMTLANPEVDLETFLDPSNLMRFVKPEWSSYWALYIDRYMRVTQTDAGHYTPSSWTIPVRRVMVDPTATRIVEALLGLILLIIATLSFLIPGRSVLPKPPFSIAAQVSMLADSQLVHRLREHGSRSESLARNEWAGMRVRLGWWNRSGLPDSKWYGVDVVDEDTDRPDRLPDMPTKY